MEMKPKEGGWFVAWKWTIQIKIYLTFFCDFLASLSLKPTVIGKLGRQVSANKTPEILK